MRNARILEGKRAVIFGAAGSIGAATAKEFAAEGAEVFLSGRTRASVEAVAERIAAAGGRAHAAVIDALDATAVDAYLDGVAEQAGAIDVEFNAVGPLASAYGSQFITARSAARHMLKRRSGVIIFLTGSPARGHVEGATAIGAAFGAVETLMENLAVELSANGIRVVCLRTTANTDSRPIQDTMEALARTMNVTKDQMIAQMASLNFLKVPSSVSDTAKAAALLGSDRVRMVTGTVFNSTAGAAMD